MLFSEVDGKMCPDHVTERFFKSDKPFKSYDHISIYSYELRNTVQYMLSVCIYISFILSLSFAIFISE